MPWSTDPLGRLGLLTRFLCASYELEETVVVLFIGDDWAEAHHDIELVDGQGRLLARRRLPEGMESAL